MKTTQQMIIGAILSFGLFAQASEEMIRIDGAIKHNCTISLSNQNQNMTYKNFTSAVNTFKSMHNTVPASKRYNSEIDSTQTIITLNTHSAVKTLGNAYSNCMSLALARDPVFAQAGEAAKYLLSDSGGFIDVCWSNYDGLVGLSRAVTKVGTNKDGKAILEVGPERSIKQYPGLEINLAKRSVVHNSYGERLSLSPSDLLTNRSSLFIEGEGSISRKIGDVNLEVRCSIQEDVF